MSRCIMHADLDEFFVSVERKFNPDLAGKPVVVGGNRHARGVVACASYEARAYGIKSGMPLVMAGHLCPDAVFINGNFRSYREASEGFMAVIVGYTPEIECLGLEEAYLDLTGFEPLYGPVKMTARKIKERVKEELGLAVSVGIAGSKVVAKVASRVSKPDGLIEVPPGEERLFLAPLPVDKLPCVGPKARGILAGLGIATIGELSKMPASYLKQAFGVHGEVMHNYANGIDSRKVEPRGRARSISREITFTADTRDLRYLHAVLYYLSERVGARLRSQVRQARRVTLKLRYADFESITRSISSDRPVDTDRSIFDAGRVLLERALHRSAKPVRLLGIGVSGLIDGRQAAMDGMHSEAMERVNRAVDRIRGRYGFGAIEVGRTIQLRPALHDRGIR